MTNVTSQQCADEAEDFESELVDRRLEPFEESSAVSFVKKNPLSSVATGHDMVDCTGELNSQSTCHFGTIPRAMTPTRASCYGYFKTASLCIYLLLGVIWALVYSLLGLQSGAFSYARAEEQQMRFGTEGNLALYFSFVTMTTLGYGDISPVSDAARAVVTLQAIFGQLYLTVLVAWLVGLHIAHSRSDSKAEE